MKLVRSLPERFALTVAPGAAAASRFCSFFIPSGKWTAGTWTVIGEIPAGTPFLQKSIGSDILSYYQAARHGERYKLHAPMSQTTLDMLNRAPGGCLGTRMANVYAEPQPDGATDIVVACTLSLEGAAQAEAVTGVGHPFTLVFDPTSMPTRPRKAGSPGTNVGRRVTSSYLQHSVPFILTSSARQ